MEKLTLEKKAHNWIMRQKKRYKGLLFEPRPRNYGIVESYRHDLEAGALLPGDIKVSGAPAKQWRNAYRKFHET